MTPAWWIDSRLPFGGVMLSEAEWRILKDLLPVEPSMRDRGRRPAENRAVLNGIL
jgi:transposase